MIKRRINNLTPTKVVMRKIMRFNCRNSFGAENKSMLARILKIRELFFFKYATSVLVQNSFLFVKKPPNKKH